MPKPVVVLGAGNTGCSIAAKLALAGREVVLWEHESHAASLAPFHERPQLRLLGAGGEGTATLALVTTDAAEALSAGDVLLASVPSYAHAAFADALLPHLRSEHLLALLPGNLGSLAFAHTLNSSKSRSGKGPLLAESDTAPYVCRKTAPDAANIWGVVPAVGIGVFL
ncbi:MAG: 2-dehydropantoate 2-reductase N-terminal domain-containing protein, partial [Chloroflexota bacterium]